MGPCPRNRDVHKEIRFGSAHGILGEKNVRAEEYIDFVGEMMYPRKMFKPYGYHPEDGRVGSFEVPFTRSNSFSSLSIEFLL